MGFIGTSNSRIRICRLGVSSSAHFKRGAARTMEGLTPRYKRGDWPTVNTQTGGQRDTETGEAPQTPRLAARSGFDTYLSMAVFPHCLLGIRRQRYRCRAAQLQPDVDRNHVSAALSGGAASPEFRALRGSLRMSTEPLTPNQNFIFLAATNSSVSSVSSK